MGGRLLLLYRNTDKQFAKSKAKLNIDVKTDEGSLEISIKDADDNTIFSETISETISFSVDVREKVIVSVSGKEHNGGFTISY